MAATEELTLAVVEAINDADPPRFGSLVDERVEIHTARGVRVGRGEAEEWVAKSYEHLERRWAIDEVRLDGDRALLIGRVQYVWRESDEVADEEPTALGMRFAKRLLAELHLLADAAAGEAWLASEHP